MDIKERIYAFIEHKGISERKFLISSGISTGYMKNFKTSMGSDKLAGVMKAYPDLNIEWLILGDGEGRKMLKSSDTANSNESYRDSDISELILNLSKTISDQQGKISSLTEQLKNEEVINNKLRNEIELLKSISKSTRSQKAM
ncbi:hypothetical protein [Coprobacter fastidiosus]|uniref:hypothetical protein n=1 Tax=Coprobacter fastidiosus TaxID=1099853 RepID=UPI003A93235C